MALLFMDGFSGGDVTMKWDGYINPSGIGRTTSSPRIAGCAYMDITSASGNANIRKQFTASAEIFIGVGFRTTGDLYFTFLGDTNTTTHLTFKYTSATKVFTLYRGSSTGTLLATGTASLLTSTWHYIEMHVKISDTVGVAEMRLDGSSTADISYSGDTKNAGTNASVDNITIQTTAFLNFDVTDVYICDTTGILNNTWLGDVCVRTLVPNGNGAFSQLVGSDSDSVNNYLLVNEQPISSTQYVGSPTTGQHDSYTMTDLPAGATGVFGLQLNTYMAKSDATAASGKPMLRIVSTNYYGVTRLLGTSYQAYTDVFDANPRSTLGWTVSDVNNLETGMEVG